MNYTAEQQIASLRALADFIEANLSLPWDGYVGMFHDWTLIVPGVEQVAAFAASPGGWDKRVYGPADGGNFELSRQFGDVLSLKIVAPRAQVCERKVVGTEVVQVPDPDAPTVTVEREVVEWECKPVLSAVNA